MMMDNRSNLIVEVQRCSDGVSNGSDINYSVLRGLVDNSLREVSGCGTLIGYNRHLTDFDLKLPAGARMPTVVIGKEVLLEQLDRQGGSQRTLERWESTNQLELLPEGQQRLRNQLNQLIQRNAEGWSPEDTID